MGIGPIGPPLDEVEGGAPGIWLKSTLDDELDTRLSSEEPRVCCWKVANVSKKSRMVALIILLL
jgi:hypothetical protein